LCRPATIFTENWNGGSINPARWDVTTGNGVIQVKSLGGGEIDLDVHFPPWEIEVRFSPEHETAPWNFFCDLDVYDNSGSLRGFWHPGVGYIPAKNRHRFVDAAYGGNPVFNVEFTPEIPEAVLAAWPILMLIRMISDEELQVGFCGSNEDAWTLSEVLDVTSALGGPVWKLGKHRWSTNSDSAWAPREGQPVYPDCVDRRD
jgi:hypothetical protein